jgi:hypothetical protein
MIHLFDLVGGEVVAHADLWALPPFETVYKADKDKAKAHANKVAKFIILCDYWDSPYVKSIGDPKLRESKLKAQIFKDENYELTTDEQICRDSYKELITTRNLRMLNSIRNKLDTISAYYENSLEEELDESKIQKLLAGFEKVKGTVQTIDFLEKAVKAEELETSKIRGDAKVNPFELPK